MDFDNTAQLDTMARVNPVIPPKQPWQFKDSVWSRPYKGMAEGIMQGAAAVTELGTLAKNIALGNNLEPDGLKTPSYSGANAWGDRLRQDAMQFRPDPATTGLAENVVHGVFRIVPKAAAYMVAAGPAGGAVALGTDEAMAVDADLASKGVDEATRHKVAAVAGVAAGAGVVLPLAGPTLKATAGLYLAGGPGAFMAQQAATREILAEANYAELAKQYDPLDPAGLAVASAIPLPFAAWGAARNIRTRVSPEVADAAMTHNLTLQRDIHEATKPSEPTITVEPAPTVRAEPNPAGAAEPKPAPKIAAEAPAGTVAAPEPVKLPQLDEHAQAVVQRVAEIEQADPAVKQRMDLARDEVVNGTDAELGTLDADLVRVAADCFLSLG